MGEVLIETVNCNFDSLSGLLKCCGDSLRLQVFAVLNEQSYSVQELCQIFDVRQPNMSHHLKLLAEQGLIVAHKVGNNIYYAQAVSFPSQVSALLSSLETLIEGLRFDEQVNEAIKSIEQQRAENSIQFFEKNIATFRQNQELIVGCEQYYPTALEILKASKLERSAHVLEVGPGEGGFLQLLDKQFQSITAIDTSAALLEKAKAEVAVDSIEFIAADAQKFQSEQGFDACVMNMVLHHIPSPKQAIKNLAGQLKPNGVILITDLCSHQQEWAKTHCGDMWLGFEQEQLSEWMSQQGLEQENNVFSGLRNGFQIFYSVYRKTVKN